MLTTDPARVLLRLRRKGRFWVQLGGHVEPADATIEAVALREGAAGGAGGGWPG